MGRTNARHRNRDQSVGPAVLTLAVTSSTAVVGVALLDGERVLAARHLVTDRRHAEELTPMIRDVLAEAGQTLPELDRLAVDVGPGRFTGLRVGIATVRTLAFAADKPVVGVSSLEALAATQMPFHAASQPGKCVTAVIDARRSEVFQQRFGPDPSGVFMPLDEPSYGPPEEMILAVQDGDMIVGDGADRYVDVYGQRPGATHVVGVEPMAEHIARLSLDRPAVPGPSVSPVYLREPDVKVNIKTRHNS